MDESEAISYLMTQFPYKSEAYLRQTFRNCNCNMSATIDAIDKDIPRERHGSGNFFGSIFGSFRRLCCTKRQSLPTSTLHDQNPETSTRNHEEIIEINIGEEFARNLSQTFSDSSLNLPTGFEPIIKIPVALGRQFHAAYVDSVLRQQEAHNKIVADLIKEDEEFARQLQEEELKSNEAGAVALNLKEPIQDTKWRSKEEFPKVHQDLFHGEQTAEEAFEIATTDSVDENDWFMGLKSFQQPATVYREQAQEHLMKRKQFYSKAKQFQKERNRGLANYYFQLAKKETKLYEQANNFAAVAFLAENHERNPSNDTIDLHHLFVKEAIQALDIFLDDHIRSLENGMCETKSLMVITGRGKHSLNGIPKIKPAVMERLRLRKLKYSQVNPGLLKVHISKYSKLFISDLM